MLECFNMKKVPFMYTEINQEVLSIVIGIMLIVILLLTVTVIFMKHYVYRG